MYTFQLEPRFETKFKVHIGHPGFDNAFLYNSSAVQELLNASELDKIILPHYQFNHKNGFFTVATQDKSAKEVVTEVFTEAMRQEVMQLQHAASSFDGVDRKQLILNNNANKNLFSWTNQDIAKLNPEEVVQTIKFSFSKPQSQYPNPFKHGVIGIVIGLALAFGWMMSVIVIREFSRQKK